MNKTTAQRSNSSRARITNTRNLSLFVQEPSLPVGPSRGGKGGRGGRGAGRNLPRTPSRQSNSTRQASLNANPAIDDASAQQPPAAGASDAGAFSNSGFGGGPAGGGGGDGARPALNMVGLTCLTGLQAFLTSDGRIVLADPTSGSAAEVTGLAAVNPLDLGNLQAAVAARQPPPATEASESGAAQGGPQMGGPAHPAYAPPAPVPANTSPPPPAVPDRPASRARSQKASCPGLAGALAGLLALKGGEVPSELPAELEEMEGILDSTHPSPFDGGPTGDSAAPPARPSRTSTPAHLRGARSPPMDAATRKRSREAGDVRRASVPATVTPPSAGAPKRHRTAPEPPQADAAARSGGAGAAARGGADAEDSSVCAIDAVLRAAALDIGSSSSLPQAPPLQLPSSAAEVSSLSSLTGLSLPPGALMSMGAGLHGASMLPHGALSGATPLSLVSATSATGAASTAMAAIGGPALSTVGGLSAGGDAAGSQAGVYPAMTPALNPALNPYSLLSQPMLGVAGGAIGGVPSTITAAELSALQLELAMQYASVDPRPFLSQLGDLSAVIGPGTAAAAAGALGATAGAGLTAPAVSAAGPGATAAPAAMAVPAAKTALGAAGPSGGLEGFQARAAYPAATVALSDLGEGAVGGATVFAAQPASTAPPADVKPPATLGALAPLPAGGAFAAASMVPMSNPLAGAPADALDPAALPAVPQPGAPTAAAAVSAAAASALPAGWPVAGVPPGPGVGAAPPVVFKQASRSNSVTGVHDHDTSTNGGGGGGGGTAATSHNDCDASISYHSDVSNDQTAFNLPMRPHSTPPGFMGPRHPGSLQPLKQSMSLASGPAMSNASMANSTSAGQLRPSMLKQDNADERTLQRRARNRDAARRTRLKKMILLQGGEARVTGLADELTSRHTMLETLQQQIKVAQETNVQLKARRAVRNAQGAANAAHSTPPAASPTMLSANASTLNPPTAA